MPCEKEILLQSLRSDDSDMSLDARALLAATTAVSRSFVVERFSAYATESDTTVVRRLPEADAAITAHVCEASAAIPSVTSVHVSIAKSTVVDSVHDRIVCDDVSNVEPTAAILTASSSCQRLHFSATAGSNAAFVHPVIVGSEDMDAAALADSSAALVEAPPRAPGTSHLSLATWNTCVNISKRQLYCFLSSGHPVAKAHVICLQEVQLPPTP